MPPGAAEGSRIRITGQGSPGFAGGPPGDLLLTIHVEPHPFFKREGDDLYLDVPITLAEAYRGEKIRVPTPEGEVNLKVPARTQTGALTRLRGKGVGRKGKEPGDLYVRFLGARSDGGLAEGRRGHRRARRRGARSARRHEILIARAAAL